MEVKLTDAAGIVDKFEKLMSSKGVSIPQHLQTSADMRRSGSY